MSDLTPADRAIIEFERAWRSYVGRRKEAVFEEFGLSLSAYNARRRVTIAKPAAMKYAPTVVKRLRHKKWDKNAVEEDGGTAKD